MQIQDLIEKVTEQGISLWDLRNFVFTIIDENHDTYIVSDIKVYDDRKVIRLKIKKNEV